MSHAFKLKILTPDKKLFEGSVLKLVLPTLSGEITILSNHAPLISLISIGEIKIENENKDTNTFLVQGGVVDIKESANNTFEVVILADQEIELDNALNLDEEVKRAKEAMELKKDDYDYAFDEAVIERSLFLKRMKSK